MKTVTREGDRNVIVVGSGQFKRVNGNVIGSVKEHIVGSGKVECESIRESECGRWKDLRNYNVEE